MRHLAAIVASITLAACGSDAPSGATRAEAQPPDTAELASAREAIAGAFVPQLDPHTLNDAEIAKALPTGAGCMFRYTSSGKPVVVVAATAAPVAALKVNGKLTVLPQEPPARQRTPVAFAAEGVRVRITDVGDAPASAGDAPREAELSFEVGSALKVGYRGYYECRPERPS